MTATQQPPPQEQPARDEGIARLIAEQKDPARVANRETAKRRPS